MREEGKLQGKYTVEFRNIRPYKSPEHAQAMAELLLNVMDKMADPKLLVPVREISEIEYYRFHGVVKTKVDWSDVKKDLGLKTNRLQEEMINEYIDNLKSQAVKYTEGAVLVPAYSPKEKKGTYFEVVQTSNSAVPPQLIVGEKTIPFHELNVGKQKVWSAFIRTDDVGVSAQDIQNQNRVSITRPFKSRCEAGMAGALGF